MPTSCDFLDRFQQIKRLKKRILKMAATHATPFYVYDPQEVQTNLRVFKSAFKKAGQPVRVVYAIKSNPYLGLLKTVVQAGEGLDASSVRELKLAVAAGAKQIVYTGPAKTAQDFELILNHTKRVTVHLESLRELRLLNTMAQKAHKTVRCGVRIVTGGQAGWVKFGIPLRELRAFFDASKVCDAIRLSGIHFHISMNKNAERYVKSLQELGDYLKKNFSAAENERWEFFDIGGGIYPQVFEAIYPWNPDQVAKFFSNETHFSAIFADRFTSRTLPIPVEPIQHFADAISQAFQRYIRPLAPATELYAEPGRFISHSAMHILLRLIDIKQGRLGIADGGNNMIGWEKYQFFNYTPFFNLSQFTLEREIPFITYGSLCTPDDIWGYYLYTKGAPQEGDTLLMPFQGGYTYTLAQSFIRDIPAVYPLD